MELTPLVPVGRQIIEHYAESGFRVSGMIYRGSILVFPDSTLSWSAAALSEITRESLAPVTKHGGVKILLLGLGRLMREIPRTLRTSLHTAGIVIEPMDTGAACRTYNVLVGEDRNVAAALLPLSASQ